ncbi:alpha-amylase family glycosyl hydrolase [Winogradskyella maritima]|uniref:Alpha-amylase family glycosyl hydrolase n=1 Tax=Winogradskyella maritima TaxID=1517766 RepID=A0ABV8AJ76_9FLAO|nr:alpha-amylase family glycosyl hydrolase [Winogradskyella maritima]
MKQLIAVFSLALVMVSCQDKAREEVDVAEVQSEEMQLEPIQPEDLETAIIYEANIRQYSPEGTFDAFTKDIPQLKDLGVKVIWLMPVFPISETKRKATGGPESKFASEFPEEEQDKYLGSYYAVTDFTEINPEFGTKDDFRELVKTAHANGIYVILDWVPNHTGWDHEWLKTNPEYYTQNEDGEVIHPKDTDWTDVADLNYDNAEMRKEMIADMLYWVKEENIDGFRCDVAGSVPTDFWEQAVPKIRAEKDVFMLAEAWESELLKGNLFDMAYAWDGHHLMNGLAKNEKTASDFKAYLEKINSDYEADDILMNFVTNHDENSWNGTIKERMGANSEVMTAMVYTIDGMPLIYSGQEYNLDHRLKFFEKDSIPKKKGSAWSQLEALGKLKKTNPALHGGKNGASLELFETPENVIAFKREKDGNVVLFMGNLSNETVKISSPVKGKFTDYMSNSDMELNDDALSLEANSYKILVQ